MHGPSPHLKIFWGGPSPQSPRSPPPNLVSNGAINWVSQLGPVSITKLSPNWACQMGPFISLIFCCLGSRHLGTWSKSFPRSCLLGFVVLTQTQYHCCSRERL